MFRPLMTIGVGCLALGSLRGERLILSGVRHAPLGAGSRISVDLNGEFRFRQERLSSPDRIYFDIAGARVASGIRRAIDVDGRLVRRIRVAQTQPNVARVVIDLTGDSTAKASADGRRLVIEIRPRGAESTAPVAAPQPPKPPVPAPFVRPTVAAAMPIAQPPAPLAEPAVAAVATAALPKPPIPEGAMASPAQRNRTGGRSLTRALGLKLGKVVIDPGHGGHDVGTSTGGRLYEKDIVLDVSRRLAALIEERLGSEVILTRTEDVFVPLERRTEIANEVRADLFLSIHANSSPYRSVTGAETYYLNFTADRADLEVAARENAGSERSISDLSELIRKIALKDKLEESREFAARVQSSLQELHARSTGRTRNRGVKKAPFLVLIGASMPSVLTEIGFISNAQEEKLLRNPEHRQKIAEAICEGVARYAETLSHFKPVKVAARKSE
jgi:N-acetylmuramoyl-L-alanine amidase